VDLRDASHDDAVRVLKNTKENVTMEVTLPTEMLSQLLFKNVKNFHPKGSAYA